MAEEKEQLKIEATLDTSKLKQEAQQGMQTVVNEEKKVENQSKQTSKAIDAIGQSGKNVGNALQQSSNQGTEALKKVGNEADKTAKKIAKIDTSVQNIKLGQAIGLAGQFINSDTGKALGGYVGSQLGMSASAQGLAGSAIQGGLTGAATGAMLAGPMGAAVGGLVGAGAGLVSAAKEQERAAVALIKAADERQAINRDRTKEIDRQEAEAKKNKEFDTKFNELIAKGDFAGANKLVEEARKVSQAQFELGDKGIHNAAIQMDATPLENRGANYKSYDDYLTIRTSAQTRLGQLDNYEAQIKAAQQRTAQEQAREAERKAQEAARQAEQAKKQSEAEAKAKADEEARFEKAKDMNWKASLKEEASQYQSQINTEESFMSKMAGTRLSDSLTKMGGGSGYGVQMQGINSYVSKMSGNIASIKTVMEKCLTTIQDIDNKYSPYGGQFISDSE